MAIWIAKFLGPIILALSVPMMVTPRVLKAITDQFLENSALILISGVLAMTAGLAIINSHNVWVWRWPVIITLFGWALLLGGAFRVMAPQVAQQIGSQMMKLDHITRVAGVLWGLLGLYLCYQGYL
jgi:hypothetical protein